MKLCFLIFVFFSTVIALQQEQASSRIFKERVRVQKDDIKREPESTLQEDERDYHGDDLKAVGSMDTLSSLARVQKAQAETFRQWSSQFEVFKTNVIKFMDQTSDVLQANEKKIKTLQRVIRKIARDIDE